MNSLRQLEECGQSVWIDYIRRKMIAGGELKRLVEYDGISGVTSNPTIFEKAIDESEDYDGQLANLLEAKGNVNATEVYEKLSVEDIRMAADVLRSTYDRTGGANGYVSIEVSPYLAHDTARSISEAHRLWTAVARPNLMVKIPATREGVPAIESLLADGININITLMFSLAHYEAVAQAFLRGATHCPAPHRLASVASIFVSRLDTAIDRSLESIGTPEALALRGKTAIANAKVIYKRFREIFYGESFAELRKRNVGVQRVLWGSTGTKNPAYSDLQYVEELIGPDTINTMPVKTLDAFRDHGRVGCVTVRQGIEGAETVLERLQKMGIDLHVVTEKLQQEGVASFAASLDKLLASIAKKQHAVHS